MRRRPLFWLTISILCFAASLYFWRLGNRWADQQKATSVQPTNLSKPQTPVSKPVSQVPPERLRLLSKANQDYRDEMTSSRANKVALTNYHLSNTTEPLDQLLRSDSA